MANLFFAKAPAPIEVLNDVDGGLVNFFRVLRDDEQRARLVDLLDYTPYSREEYRECLRTWQAVEAPVEKARRWYMVLQMSIGRRFGSGWGYEVTRNSRVRGFRNSIRRFDAIAERLRYTQIENNDFRKVIKAYDSPNTLFYNDPPYVHDTRNAQDKYQHEMSLDDHRDLVGLLLNLRGMALLSGYRHEVYEPLEAAGWRLVTFPAKTSASLHPRERGRDRLECLWVSHSAWSRLGHEMVTNVGSAEG
jgi:DNA adenine methylase